jgi:hypothetical protein
MVGTPMFIAERRPVASPSLCTLRPRRLVMERAYPAPTAPSARRNLRTQVVNSVPPHGELQGHVDALLGANGGRAPDLSE